MVLRPLTLLKTMVYNLVPWLMQEEERSMSSPLGHQLKLLVSETGYYHLQATKPDTLGIRPTFPIPILHLAHLTFSPFLPHSSSSATSLHRPDDAFILKAIRFSLNLFTFCYRRGNFGS
jgi:hypothetical protein